MITIEGGTSFEFETEEFRSREQWEDQLPHSILATMSRARNVGDMEERKGEGTIVSSPRWKAANLRLIIVSIRWKRSRAPVLRFSRYRVQHSVRTYREIKWNRRELDLLCFVRSILAKCVFTNDFHFEIWKFLNLWFLFVIVFCK